MSVDKLIDLGSLMPQRVKVKLGDQTFIVTEAGVDAGVKFSNIGQRARIALARPDADQSYGISDDEPILVGMCTFQIQADGSTPHKDPVGEEIIRGWPHATMKKVYKLIRKMSPELQGSLPTLENIEEQLVELNDIRKKLLEQQGGTPNPND